MIINNTILENFLSPFSAEQKERILGSFLNEMPERAENCVSFFQEKNYPELRKEAHTLKSLAKTIGAEKLAEQSFFIENLCNTEKFDDLNDNNVDLIDLTQQVCAALSSFK